VEEGSQAGVSPPSIDVSAYAAELQRLSRRLSDTSVRPWRELVDRGLAAAWEQRDAVGLASMVQLIGGILDAGGRLYQAVAETDHALAMAGPDPSAVAMLQAIRACFLAATGQVEAAREAIALADAAREQALAPIVVNKSRAHCAVARMMALGEIRAVDVEATMSLPAAEARDSDLLVLGSYYIPFRVAHGQWFATRPWLRSFRLAAQVAGHPWRVGDAAVFELADAAVSQPLRMPATTEVPRWNWLANWRLQALRCRAATLSRSEAAAATAELALGRARLRAGSVDLDNIGGLEAFVRAQQNPSVRVPVPDPPAQAHLLNLASVLAGAEAVAIGGSQAEAARWLDWLERSLPTRVRTCLEWPVARARVQALVALRAGAAGTARTLLSSAVTWAAAAEYPAELGIAEVQLGELGQHHSSPSQEARWRRVRTQGWDRLHGLGIDPTPHAYIVAEASIATRGQRIMPALTAREVEILALLAEGHTYRQVAARLGIAAPTVQTVAHRCYQKLAASGRARAVQAARDLNIL
jgi:DNA-binding CsgD family transcriptional regulator